MDLPGGSVMVLDARVRQAATRINLISLFAAWRSLSPICAVNCENTDLLPVPIICDESSFPFTTIEAL